MVESNTNQTTRAVTMEMIARRCGVHRSTVQRALTGGPARDTTAARIREVAEEMGYDPAAYGAAARLVSLRHGRRVLNRVIALYLPSIFARHAYYLRLLQGILEASVETDFEVLVAYYVMDDRKPTPPPRSVVSGSVDAIITAADAGDIANHLRELRSTPHFGDRPVITLFEPVPDTISVLIDDYGGARAACEHLLDLGHSHLLGLTGRLNYSTGCRLAGWRDACLGRGLDPEAHLHIAEVRWAADSTYDERAAQALTAGLAANPAITAILLPNDAHVPIVRQVLQAHDLEVPGQMSLVGFDDTDPFLDADGQNILTTVHLPLEEIGRTATRLAVQHLTGDEDAPAQAFLPVTLVTRRSTASLTTV